MRQVTRLVQKCKQKGSRSPGKHTLVFDWLYAGAGLGKGGTGTLKVDGEKVDSHPMPKSLPVGVETVDYPHLSRGERSLF